MKILITSSTDTRHNEIATGLAMAMSVNPDNNVVLWDNKQKSTFDAFDEFEPDLFICMSSCLNNSIDKNKDRTKPVLIGDFSSVGAYVGWNTYSTIINEHMPTISPAANLIQYSPNHKDERYTSKLSYVGHFNRETDGWLYPLIFPPGKHNIKIFDDKPWPTPHYVGYEPNLSKVYANTDFGLNICQDSPTGLTNTPFNILATKALCISTPNSELQKILTGFEIHYANSPDEMEYSINGFVGPKVRENIYANVVGNHSYHARAIKLLQDLDMHDNAQPLINHLREILCLKSE